MAAALEQYVNTVQNLSSQGKNSVLSNLVCNWFDLDIVNVFNFVILSYIFLSAENSNWLNWTIFLICGNCAEN